MAMSTELTEALARAHAQVRAIDWSTWQVPPGDARLAEYLFAPEPPLTNGLVGTYLSTCSDWARPITQDETLRVVTRLGGVVGQTRHGDRVRAAPRRLELPSRSPTRSCPFPRRRSSGCGSNCLSPCPTASSRAWTSRVPGAEAAAAVEQAKIPVSTLATPGATGVALDGLYSATTFGLQLDITGPPGSGA